MIAIGKKLQTSLVPRVLCPGFGGGAGRGPGTFLASSGHMTTKQQDFVGGVS